VRLVSSDYNHKFWNKSKEFDIFIGEEKNKAKAMKKERFNRCVYLSGVILHHQAQVQEFLSKYETITNTLACIVRAFFS
jgi:menaquinone-dependent protoporphyrinogen IX oxidase